MFSRFKKTSEDQNSNASQTNQEDLQKLAKEQKEYINKDFKQRVQLYQIDKCFNQCVKSFMEKLFTPYEKECLQNCIQNMVGFEIEFNNALEEI
ncbi:Tim10/DDP family zinc finger protein (macronuclear) [Tetrahymena thermophila SB210]|uniref:Mitochondrial import inner membrane translocase subunit n=1 Tax=Tetrahymena thermophila (strain SB210) TaxID=312017 RepID=W7X651_TETTS|nr:Tim10/DDP family zinc finger protein [Tetrahymena thermophila SB210]EWS72877.1 Tim10/DDP family zinc finger protein [Tetrahymena thermophila SB210]|eukprot:XP_012654584.1 Tim10/DDP family zinc finger protein [Tetrahymena thermophila SB210]